MPECRPPDQVVTSQPIAIMDLMQSSGKYDIHCSMFRSERAVSASFGRTSIDTAASGGSHGIPTKFFERALVSIDLLPVGV